jgi:hypothetical protein
MIMIDRYASWFQIVIFLKFRKMRKCNVGCVENLVRLVISRELVCTCCIQNINFYNHTSFYPRLRPQISECFEIMFLLSCIVINAVHNFNMKFVFLRRIIKTLL